LPLPWTERVIAPIGTVAPRPRTSRATALSSSTLASSSALSVLALTRQSIVRYVRRFVSASQLLPLLHPLLLNPPCCYRQNARQSRRRFGRQRHICHRTDRDKHSNRDELPPPVLYLFTASGLSPWHPLMVLLHRRRSILEPGSVGRVMPPCQRNLSDGQQPSWHVNNAPNDGLLLSARSALALTRQSTETASGCFSDFEVRTSICVPCAVAAGASSFPAHPSYPLCRRLAVFVKKPAEADAASAESGESACAPIETNVLLNRPADDLFDYARRSLLRPSSRSCSSLLRRRRRYETIPKSRLRPRVSYVRTKASSSPLKARTADVAARRRTCRTTVSSLALTVFSTT
jgi:hypothetical protein